MSKIEKKSSEKKEKKSRWNQKNKFQVEAPIAKWEKMYSPPISSSPVMKFEFNIIVACFVPFLTDVDRVGLMLTSKGLSVCVNAFSAMENDRVQRNGFSESTIRHFWAFLKMRFIGSPFLRDTMYKRYKCMLQNKKKYSTPDNTSLPLTEASMSTLIFYLRFYNRSALMHLVHSAKKLSAPVRKCIRRVHLRVERYFYNNRLNLNNKGIKREYVLLTNSIKHQTYNQINDSNMNTSATNDKKREFSEFLTSDPPKKRQKKISKRTVARVNTYSQEYLTKDKVRLLDDDSVDLEDENAEDLDAACETQSTDGSDSEGSLKDFIDKDDDNTGYPDSDEESVDSNANEKELSDRETDVDSEAYSVYSEDED